jgi:hypothetical protein
MSPRGEKRRIDIPSQKHPYAYESRASEDNRHCSMGTIKTIRKTQPCKSAASRLKAIKNEEKDVYYR